MACACPETRDWKRSQDDEWKRAHDRLYGRKLEPSAKRHAPPLLEKNVEGAAPRSRTSLMVRLIDSIRRSLSIGELKDDWDGEGSAGYSPATLKRAHEFLIRNIGVLAPPPQINPGDKGSIDLYWEDENRCLLINFPAGSEEPSYYGEDQSGSTTEGVIKSASMERQVASWLFKAGR